MQRLLFVLLLCCSFGPMSSSTVNSDLIAIASMTQDYKKYSPDIARRVIEATCGMVTECCPQTKAKFSVMALQGDTKGFNDQCFGGKDSSNALRNLLICPPLMQLATMVVDKDLLQYISAVKGDPANDREYQKLVLDVCTEQELYSMACDWKQSKEQLACQRKVLEKWATEGDQAYAKKVQDMKDGYTKLIDVLKKTFHQ